MIPLLLLLTSPALSYETDQLTDREVPLEDVRGPLNDRLNTLLSQAVERANTRTHCRADRDKAHRVLARAIRRETSRPAWVLRRGLLRAPGFTNYSAWVERNDALDKRAFEEREDVFADVTLWQSVILTTAGPSSTVAVGDHLVGTDKFDHFLHFGYASWRASRRGERPELAERFDYTTESWFFGLLTSKTFSYGDIAANHDGYLWFLELIGPDRPFRFDRAGCLTRAEDFDWSEHVDWTWDEALNPPRFTPLVQKRVDHRIEREPARYCRAWEVLGGPEYDAHIEEVLAQETRPPPLRKGGRPDPWKLSERCAEADPQP